MARKFVSYSDLDGSALTLGDDSAGDAVSVGAPDTDNAVQEIKPVNAAYSQRIDRGNVTNTMPWRVERFHGSELKAQDFYRDHGQAVANQGTSTLEDSGSNINPRWWLNSKVKAKRVSCVGQNTVFEYSVRAGQIVAAKPKIPPTS